jgi:integrase
MLKKYLIPFLGAKLLSTLTANDLDKLYANMVTDGLSATTTRYLHRIIHKVLKVAVKKGRISQNVAKDANPPKQERPNIEVWNEWELTAFKDAAMKYRSDLAPIYDMLAETGDRLGEVIGSKRGDLKNFHGDSPKWSVQRTVYKRCNGEWLINKPKTKIQGDL